MRTLVAFFLLTAFAIAQESRTVIHFDGDLRERITTDGTSTFVSDPMKFAEGLAALRIAPGESDRYYGFTVHDLGATHPSEIRFKIFLEGTVPKSFKLKIDDGRSGKGDDEAGWFEKDITPQKWIDVAFSLKELRNRTDRRTLDFAKGVTYFRWSRAKDDINDSAFLVDDLRFFGESEATAITALRDALKLEDREERAQAIREKLPLVPEVERVKVALEILSNEGHESVRRSAREAIGSSGSPLAAAAMLKAVPKAKSERLEVLWALAAMSSPITQIEVAKLIGDPKTSGTERTALVNGSARRGRKDFAALEAACPPQGPWNQRAALVRALAHAGTDPAIDGLISVLERPLSVRIRTDAASALERLTGKDLGDDAKAFGAWWKVNRGKVDLGKTGESKPRSYATSFYGIPILEGRMAFVLDISGSMREPASGPRIEDHKKASRHLDGRDIKTRLDLAKAELEHAIDGLSERSHFAIVVYNDEVLWLTKGFEKVNAASKEAAKKRIGAVSPGQATNIHDGLLAAFQPNKKPSPKDWEDGADTVFLLSDGQPSAGPIRRSSELRDAVLRWNLSRALKINAVNVGEQDARWLNVLTRESGGSLVNLRSAPDVDDEKEDKGP